MPRILRGPSTAGPTRNFRSPLGGPAFIFALALFPDLVGSPQTLPTAARPASFGPVAPERTAPLAAAVYPDWIESSRGLARQLAAFATEESPRPERTAPLAASAFPDRIERVTLSAAAHPFATEQSPRPERTAPLAATTVPDRIERAFLPAAAHPYAPMMPAQPERTAPLASAGYPDRAEHAGSAAGAPFTAAPVAPVALAAPVWGWTSVEADRPAPLPFRIGPFAAVCWSLESTVAFVGTRFPDRIDALARPALGWSGLSPRPERTAPLAGTTFPDRVDRSAFLPTSGGALPPSPERTAPLAGASFSDRVERAAAAPGAWLALPPRPERTAPLAASVLADLRPLLPRPFAHEIAIVVTPEPSPEILAVVHAELRPLLPRPFAHEIALAAAFEPLPELFAPVVALPAAFLPLRLADALSDPDVLVQPAPPPPPPPAPPSAGSGAGGAGYPARRFAYEVPTRTRSQEMILLDLFEQVETAYHEDPNAPIEALLAAVDLPDLGTDAQSALIDSLRAEVARLVVLLRAKDRELARLHTFASPDRGRALAGALAALVGVSYLTGPLTGGRRRSRRSR